GRPLRLQPGRDLLGALEHPQDVAAGQPGEVGVAPAAAGELGEEGGEGGDVLEPDDVFGDPVEVAADPDVIDARDLAHVVAGGGGCTSARAPQWEKITGASVASSAALIVPGETCERSTSIPSRFISWTTSRPNGVRPPCFALSSAASAQSSVTLCVSVM